MLLHLAGAIAYARSVLVQIGRHCDHLELGEPMQSRLNGHPKAGLERRDQVLVVHVDDGEVDAFDQPLLFYDHVALDDAVECHQNDHVGVQDVTGQVAKELDHAEGSSLNRRKLTQFVQV